MILWAVPFVMTTYSPFFRLDMLVLAIRFPSMVNISAGSSLVAVPIVLILVVSVETIIVTASLSPEALLTMAV